MPTQLPQSRKIKIYIILVIVSILVTVADYIVPLGVAGGVPYILVVLISLNLNKPKVTLYVTVGCILLTTLGYFLSPDGGVLWMVWANRLLAIFAITITGYLGNRLKQSEMDIQKVADMPQENPNPVLRISYKNTILYANPAARELFGSKSKINKTFGSANQLPGAWKKKLPLLNANRATMAIEYPLKNKTLSFHFTHVPNAEYINAYAVDITDRKIMEKQLLKTAETDELTGIYNRRVFNKSIAQEWKRAKRFKTTLSLLILDVDYFKKYNDTYGHQAGDNTLKKVAKIMETICNRPGDLVARYGGEEFVVLLPATGVNGAMSIAEKVRVAIEEKKIRHDKSKIFGIVTASIGVATMAPGSKLNSKGLIQAADKALYTAKKKGRNCTVEAK